MRIAAIGIVRATQACWQEPTDHKCSNRQLTPFSQRSGTVEFEGLVIVNVAFWIGLITGSTKTTPAPLSASMFWTTRAS